MCLGVGSLTWRFLSFGYVYCFWITFRFPSELGGVSSLSLSLSPFLYLTTLMFYTTAIFACSCFDLADSTTCVSWRLFELWNLDLFLKSIFFWGTAFLLDLGLVTGMFAMMDGLSSNKLLASLLASLLVSLYESCLLATLGCLPGIGSLYGFSFCLINLSDFFLGSRYSGLWLGLELSV